MPLLTDNPFDHLIDAPLNPNEFWAAVDGTKKAIFSHGEVRDIDVGHYILIREYIPTLEEWSEKYNLEYPRNFAPRTIREMVEEMELDDDTPQEELEAMFDELHGVYTGDFLLVRVTHVLHGSDLRDAMADDCAVLSFQRMEVRPTGR